MEKRIFVNEEIDARSVDDGAAPKSHSNGTAATKRQNVRASMRFAIAAGFTENDVWKLVLAKPSCFSGLE
jgi:hypothetical protein